MFNTISFGALTTVVGGQCQCSCGPQSQGEQDPNAVGGDPNQLAMQQPGGGDPNQPAQDGPQGGAQGFDWRKLVGLIGGFMQQFAQI